ncbi:MAG: hypothetical protein JXQ84_03820 [Rhodospirillaceae bacterium]|nr:hypothetical protein [Rhodospirillaceae bacterium]
MTVQPSVCPVSGRDAFDLMVEAFGETVVRPLWLLRTALFPFVAVWGVAHSVSVFAPSGVKTSVWFMALCWVLEAAAFVPCVLAWCRIGFFPATDMVPPSPLERTGLWRGLDLLVLVMLAIAGLAGLLDVVVSGATAGQIVFPARGMLVFSGGLVLIPTLILGGMRLLVAVAAAAIGWKLSYTEAFVLTAHRNGWLAGVGLAFVCLYPLTIKSMDSLREIVGAPLYGVPGVWNGIEFGLVVLLVAVSGHALGRILRRLLDGMPQSVEA